MFENFNDYELLYLISEGNYRAYDAMISKYQILSNIISRNYIQDEYKRDDMVQEGLLVLIDCIKHYNEFLGVSFFSYFSVCLKRKYALISQKSYYKMINFYSNPRFNLSETNTYFSNKEILDVVKELDEEAINIYNECMIGNLTLKDYSRIYNISLNVVYKKYELIKKRIKEYLKEYCGIYK